MESKNQTNHTPQKRKLCAELRSDPECGRIDVLYRGGAARKKNQNLFGGLPSVVMVVSGGFIIGVVGLLFVTMWGVCAPHIVLIAFTTGLRIAFSLHKCENVDKCVRDRSNDF